jgi:hypothetical protein
MPPPAAKEPGAVKEEDQKHRKNTQTVDIISSLWQNFPPLKPLTNNE